MGTELAERNIKLVKEMYAASTSGNWEKAESMLTEDFFVSEGDMLPFHGVYGTRKGLQNLFTKVMSMAAVKDLQIHGMTASDDCVVVLLDLVLEGTPETRAAIAEVFYFRDGLVREIKPFYFSPTPMIEAVKRKSAAGG